MNNQDKIVATVAIFLKTESSDEYLYCLSGGKQRILAAIKNKLGWELESCFRITVEAHIPHGVEDYSDEAGRYRQFAKDIEKLISDEVDKIRNG